MDKRIPRVLVISAIVMMFFTYLSILNVRNSENNSVGVLSRIGSRGTEVRSIQTRLKSWGYYKGSVDGVYGTATYRAVKLFQSKNRLTPDGIAGIRTLAAIGIPEKTPATTTGYTNKDINIVAHLIHGESRGEPYLGKVAVGAVILNRVSDDRFPKTIASVIYQPGAFDAVSDGQINLTPDDSSIKAARDAMNGWDPTKGCIYYYNPVTATSKWIWSRPIMLKIGNHNFAK